MERNRVIFTIEPHPEILNEPSIQNPFTEEQVYIHLKNFKVEFQDGVKRYNYGKSKEN